jgi:predicted O-methyltransferase YrrM
MTHRSLDEVLATTGQIDGWMSTDQLARLYRIAATRTAGDQIVEIGSFRGRSTIALAGAAPDGVSIVAIDAHAGNDRGPREISGFESEAADDHDVFVSNLEAAGVADRVRHLRQFSEAAHPSVDGTIAVLLIDGAHRYTPARYDIRTWGARVQRNGTMVIHDSFSSVGVTLAIGRELIFGNRFRYVGRSRSLAEYRADLGDGHADRFENAIHQLAELPWFAKNLVIKALLTAGCGKLVGRLTGRPPDWPY